MRKKLEEAQREQRKKGNNDENGPRDNSVGQGRAGTGEEERKGGEGVSGRAPVFLVVATMSDVSSTREVSQDDLDGRKKPLLTPD